MFNVIFYKNKRGVSEVEEILKAEKYLKDFIKRSDQNE